MRLRVQPEEIDVTGPAGLVVLDRSYRYRETGPAPAPSDPGPNLDQVIDHRDPSESQYYFYDELSRLSKVTTLAGTPLFEYGYDLAGNRTTEVAGSNSWTFTYEMAGSLETDRIASRTGSIPQRYYHHDAFGNRDYEADSPWSGTPRRRYDDANRLVEVKDASGAVTGAYVYDAFGRRVKKTTGPTSTLFFYHAGGEILEQLVVQAGLTDYAKRFVFVEGELLATVDHEGSFGSAAWTPAIYRDFDPDLRGPVTTAILLGTSMLLLYALHPRGRRVAVAPLVFVAALPLTSCPGAATLSFVHTDPLGMPLAVTDMPSDPAMTRAVWRARYEPFGKATVDENPDGNSLLYKLAVRFPGQYFDLESGYHYNFFRDYDPTTGRYIEPDPIGQTAGANLYAYVDANPVAQVDVDGLIAGSVAATWGAGSVTGSSAGSTGFVGGGIGVAAGPAAAAASLVGAFGVGYWIGSEINSVITDDVQAVLDDVSTWFSHGKEKGRNWATEEAKAVAKERGVDPCTVLAEMLDAAEGSAERAAIQRAQRFLGCRGSRQSKDKCS